MEVKKEMIKWDKEWRLYWMKTSLSLLMFYNV